MPTFLESFDTVSFRFWAGASRGRSHDGQRFSGTVPSMHIWRSLFSGAAKNHVCLPTDNFSFASKTMKLGRRF